MVASEANIASEVKYNLRFEISDSNYPLLMHVHIAYILYGMGPSGSLQGHYSLETALEVKSDLRFEIRPQLPTYTCAYCFFGMGPFASFWSHATKASK